MPLLAGGLPAPRRRKARRPRSRLRTGRGPLACPNPARGRLPAVLRTAPRTVTGVGIGLARWTATISPAAPRAVSIQQTRQSPGWLAQDRKTIVHAAGDPGRPEPAPGRGCQSSARGG